MEAPKSDKEPHRDVWVTPPEIILLNSHTHTVVFELEQ